MITKTKQTIIKVDKQIELLRLVLQEVRAMRRDFQKAQSADALLANVPEVEDVMEKGETVIFNADRDNGGRGISPKDIIKAIDAIDG